MTEGGQEPVKGNEEIAAISSFRELESRVRDFERLPGRKPMEIEILGEALGRDAVPAIDAELAVAAEDRHHDRDRGLTLRATLGRLGLAAAL